MIRKPLLVKAQTALTKNKNKNKIWQKTIFNMADGILTTHSVAQSDIDFASWLHPAMWHIALESWQWIHQVAAPCNVIRGSGMTCRWIRPVAAPFNVAGDSGIKCHGIHPNVRRIGILHLVSILTISPQSTCHSAPCSLQNFIQIWPLSAEKNDFM